MLTDVQLILLDIDGTLLMTHGAGRESMRLAMLDIFGTCEGLAEHPFGGKTDWLILHELLLQRGQTEASIRQHMPAYSAAMGRYLEQIIDQYTVVPCPGALDFVRQLRRRKDVTMGLLTGNAAATAPIKLRAAGFDPAWFAVAAYGSESVNRNDLPALAVERAERQLQRRLSPRQVVIIGDTPADVACAQAYGAVSVAVTTGFSPREELLAAKPDYLLDDLTTFFGRVMM